MEESSFSKGFKITLGVAAALVVIFIAMPVGCVACMVALG